MVNRTLAVGIDPSGNGTTGIYIKSFNCKNNLFWHTQIKNNNPIDAFVSIVNYIQQTLNSCGELLELGSVVVEVLHGGAEVYAEVKQTRELIGLLRYYYKCKFKGHLPNHKNKNDVDLLIKKHGKKAEHWIHAKAILEAHLVEDDFGYPCENWKWVKKNGNKKNQ